jgi:helicase
MVMDIKKEVLKANSFSAFNPMQQKLLERDWQETSLVVSSPTASGKTVAAELLALNSVINKRKKAIYVCPLKAIAAEHYSSFRRKYSKNLSVRAALSTGDLDSGSRHLSGYDIIFSTYEKVDSLIRHRAEWLGSVGLLVVDEIHSLGSDRGPTLEIMIAAMRMISPRIQILGLSATIPNAAEISGWLGAELVTSSYRPVKLVERLYLDSVLYGGGEDSLRSLDTPLEEIADDTLAKRKQVLVFANTRRRAEDYAKKLSGLSCEAADAASAARLGKEADAVLKALESPTEQCRLLAELIKKGAAFHHAGLMPAQREIVEDAFRKNLIKVVSSTTTLAAGINMPAFRVVIPSLYRYTSSGSRRIPVNEYKQMAGRSGRPEFDTRGESVIIAKTEAEKEELCSSYINGEPEEIVSGLSHEPVLRMHLLSAIANGFVFDLLSLEDFIKKTFYHFQNSGAGIFSKINPVLRELHEMGFVEGDEERFSATALGKRVSQLYLDPLSANKIITSLRKEPGKELFYLYLISDTSESFPWVRVPRQKEELLWEELMENAASLPVDVMRAQYEDHLLLEKFNSSLLLCDWISEKSEEEIMKAYNIRPGVMHARRERADWLIYSAFEIARLLGLEQHLPALMKLRKRLRYGVREELVPLVSVRHIGRARARRLFRAGIKTPAHLRKTDLKDLSRILGTGVASLIKEQVQPGKVLQA